MRTLTYWLSILMIFVMPWEGLVNFPGLGTMSRLMGFAVAAMWLLSALISNRVRKITPFHVFVFLFFLWNAISIFWSADPEQTFSQAFLYVRMAGLILVIWNLYDTPTAVEAGMQAYILGSFVPVGNIINNFITGNLYGFSRYAITGNGPNSSAMIIALVIPIALYLATFANISKKIALLRLVNYAYVPAAIFAIALTATRFAMIMTVPALLFGLVALTQLKLATRILIFAFLLGSLFYLPSILPETSLVRLSTIGNEISVGDLNGRTAFWKNGLTMWVDKPLIGIGSDAFPHSVAPIYGRPRSIHSSFFAVLVETGLIGVILFGTILAIVVNQIRYLPRWEARFWVVMLVVWALGNSVMTWIDHKSTWLLLTLLVVSAANLSRQQAATRPKVTSLNRRVTTTPQHHRWQLKPRRGK